jgi:hypothetical protein
LLHFLLAELRHVETRTLGHLTKIPAHVARAKTEPGFPRAPLAESKTSGVR